MIFVHDIKLSGDTEFERKFNECSELFQKSKDKNLSEEERESYLEEFWKAKYRLEQGI